MIANYLDYDSKLLGVVFLLSVIFCAACSKTIEGNEQLSRCSSSGTGSLDDPFLIDGMCVDVVDQEQGGFFIKNTDAHVVLKNFHIQNSMIGISIDNVENLKIIDSIFSDIVEEAIRVTRSKNISIANNDVKRTGGGGVFVRNSSDIIIENNRITNTENRGIDVYLLQGENVMVSKNHVSETLTVGAGGECIEAWGNDLVENSGIVFSNNIVHDCSDEGLEFVGVIGGTMEGNVVFNNVGQGIDLWRGNSNNIVNNIVSGNQKYGMYITDSSNNSVSHNIFYGNNPYTFHIRGISDDNEFIGNILDDNRE